MDYPTIGVISFAAVSAVLVAALIARPGMLRHRVGKVLAFLAFFLLPVLMTFAGTTTHLDHAKQTDFCLSCHVMEPYGASLRVDDSDALPASHFQNRRIDREYACYTCHTTYTMFGDVEAKMKGLKHVWIYYLGQIPEEIELYEPYSNRECLHCHEGARSFEESEIHVDFREDFDTGETSCLECHDVVHAIEELAGAELWLEEEA